MVLGSFKHFLFIRKPKLNLHWAVTTACPEKGQGILKWLVKMDLFDLSSRGRGKLELPVAEEITVPRSCFACWYLGVCIPQEAESATPLTRFEAFALPQGSDPCFSLLDVFSDKSHLRQLRRRRTSGMKTDSRFQQSCARYKGTTEIPMC